MDHITRALERITGASNAVLKAAKIKRQRERVEAITDETMIIQAASIEIQKRLALVLRAVVELATAKPEPKAKAKRKRRS